MSRVRAKFIVENVALREDGGTVYLRPVTSGSDENDQFYKYTPGGSIQLSTLNQDAVNSFVVGAEYYVDFTRADVQPVSDSVPVTPEPTD